MDMEQNGTELAPVDGSALAIITSAEIDQQITTAHKWPRKLAQFKARAIEMATFDEETAESCIYSRPVGKKKNEQTGKFEELFAEGMSIRMAEIVGNCYGNLRVGSMLIEQNERFVKARGMAHDLETNFASTSEVIESTVDSKGKPYSERMRIVVAKAALSKARRDATFSVVPRALCKPIEVEARRVALGDATTLAKRRAKVMEWIGKLQIDVARVYAALGIADEEGIGLEQLATLTGLKTAMKDGDVKVDEAFPPLNGEGVKQPTSKSAAQDAQKSAKPSDPPPADAKVDTSTGEILPANADTKKAAPPKNDDRPISKGTLDLIRSLIEQEGTTEQALCEKFQIGDITKITMSMGVDLMNYLKGAE